MKLNVLFLPFALIVIAGCGFLWHPGDAIELLSGGPGEVHNPDTYHIGEHRWQADTILVRIYRTSEPDVNGSLPSVQAECASCNIDITPQSLKFDPQNTAHIFIPEARQLPNVRLHIFGSGIDTTFLQTPRPYEKASAYYNLSYPLIGRVLIEHLALLYLDSTQDSLVATANVGDELNLVSEQKIFYVVHHPNFDRPLYVLKSDAFRLE